MEPIPWDQIKLEYTCGSSNAKGERTWPSERELARKYGISRRALSKRRRAEGWDALREQNRRAIEAKAYQETIAKVSEKLAEVNAHGVDGALEMMQAARTLLRECMQRYSESRELQLSLAERVALLKDTALALRALQQMHKGALEAARLALGEPTEITEDVLKFENLMRRVNEYLDAEGIDPLEPIEC